MTGAVNFLYLRERKSIMEKNISTAAEQTETAEVKKNPKIIELARPYTFDDK